MESKQRLILILMTYLFFLSGFMQFTQNSYSKAIEIHNNQIVSQKIMTMANTDYNLRKYKPAHKNIIKNITTNPILKKTKFSAVNDIVFSAAGQLYIAGYALLANEEDAVGFIAKLSPDLKTLYQATYLGGSCKDEITSLHLGPQGDVYVAGYTSSPDFPGIQDGAQENKRGIGANIGFIAQLSPDLKTLHQATYLGGSCNDEITSLHLGPQGDVYVAGYTSSPDFPGIQGGVQTRKRGFGTGDGFIAKLSPDLKTLHQATYLGGSSVDKITSLQLGPQGEVYVAGYTWSSNFSDTQGGAQENKQNDWTPDGFIAKLSSDLKTLHQATYLGGSVYDYIQSIRIGHENEVYVVGYTYSPDFPATQDGFQDSICGGLESFISKFSSDLTTIHQSTYLGGSSSDLILKITLGPLGIIYVTGSTNSHNFPGTQGGALESNEKKKVNGIVAKLSTDLKTLYQSTYTNKQ